MSTAEQAAGDPVTVLLVDDDPALRQALQLALHLDGYRVAVAPDGAQALAALPDVRPDLLVLDLMMPYVNGLEVCRRMRAAGDRTPILALTARDQVDDRVAGLDAGADDYLVKPFALAELRARLRALARRADDSWLPGPPPELRCGDLLLDPLTRQATRGGRTFELTRTEYSLLELLLRNAGRVLTREVIVDRVWGYELEPASNSLEVFIGYLRRKSEAGGEPRLIHTVRGVGYQLRPAP
jgi:two-component system, OmpR family, response regulator MprA